ncbi:diguanylate cyclase [Papillibacter cinnamivorans]|uniref:PAS domain S-box-containing protein/diguanylate cyclase (GGDEF) domain-containing protein n=1 Tax=Papillibacter cinnamivorans DSM 12816 TaxID=1122930 RepID=A0A1W1YPI6_9FIRM|nr:diguanylate cyclase [Papillibacter cinnamivorans]SMC38022.1 PAS domain S-box-containing protein/diguanylate cyclase (GGDEF) domain-containing protein [Papillibacter cinnamivorans DSM 12816]
MKPLDLTKEQLLKYIMPPSKQESGTKAPEKAEAADVTLLYENLGLLSGASSIGLIITDTDGTILSFNKTVQDMLDIHIEEYRNTNVSALYADSKDRQRMLNLFAESNRVRDFEVCIKHKNGTLRTVLANIDNIELNHEHVLMTSLYDITQYKQRKKPDTSYRTLFSNVPVGITVTDFQGDLIVSNNAIEELLGYSANDLKYMSVRDFYLIPSDRQQLLDLTKRIGSVRDFETLFRHKNGGAVSVLINTDLIEFNGQKNMLLTSIRDISNLKRVEDALTKERDFSNTILNIAATLIVVLDFKGTITRFNRACEQISGYSFDEVKGTYLWDTTFFDPVISREELDRLFSGNYAGSYDTVLVSKYGNRYQISWTFAAMLNAEGHVDYIIATGIDITKRQEAEEQLQIANEKLASWVKELQERTEALDQLNEMGEQLQSCQTVNEACAISAQYIKRICPASHGALYLIKESRNYAEAMEIWGEPAYVEKVFEPLSCWAIRRGRQHLVDADHPGLLCGHITGPESGQYLCVPLLVNGGAIGILHLNHVDAPDQEAQETGRSYTEHTTQIVTTVAEHIALALSNLKLKETLRQQSIRDALTGLFNRRYMEETLERELKRAEREDKPVGIIMFDIDHFKQFNDLAGHDAGDALLRELGAFLNRTTRGGDVVCRYGGEEFLVVLPGADMENSRQWAEKLRLGVKELLVYHLGKPLGKCTISLGVSSYPENGPTAEALLKAADRALYRAKNDGRDRVVTA